jgi:RNA polymerase sigma factor (sigma-70 family)
LKEHLTYLLLGKNKNAGLKLLYERYGKKLYSYAVASWKLNEDDAWDITYKALFQVCEKVDTYSFKDEKSFAGFLFTVFINLLRNHVRDNHPLRPEPLNSEELADHSAQESESESAEMQQLHLELARLEDWERILLLLRCQDMPYAEIAKYTGRPPHQLKVYYARLKEKLGRRLSSELLKKPLK